MIWRCPRCRGELAAAEGRLTCTGCHSSYAQVDGIPDLRVPRDAWINFDDDLEIARELAASTHLTLEELVRSVYARRPGWDADRIALRTRQVLQGPRRLERETREWLAPLVGREDILLDLGCGAGMLIAAAHQRAKVCLGIDVSMTWLVVAKRLIAEFGGEPVLAAALGEALPLSDHSVDVLVSLDVIEHVNAPDDFLIDVDRVLRPGGRAVLTTPNRFSLTAEPHVQVWGVGWLPQPLQARFVRWRSGKDYSDTRLMSSRRLERMLRANTQMSFQIETPSVPLEEIARFSPPKSLAAKIYNRICRSRLLRPIFLFIGPFFRVVGQKA